METLHHDRTAERLAVGLGWFSLGLGAVEIAAPGAIARVCGIRRNGSANGTIQAFGAREIAAGVAVLMQPDRAAWLWTRVAGDAVDLAGLGRAMAYPETDRRRAIFATASVAGVTALDILGAVRLARAGRSATRRADRTAEVVCAVTINRSIEDVYQFWRQFTNFPRFMQHVESVELIDDRRSRWRAKAPAGTSVEWEALIIEDRENESITWRSLDGSSIDHFGSVRFERAPGARGTELHVRMRYSPPAGELGRAVAWLFGEEPSQQVRDDLRRFKQLMETGEIPISEGPGLSRAAQPPATPDELRRLTEVHR